MPDRLLIAPPAADWLPPLRAAGAPMLSPDAQRFRTQLGLPIDRPIILSGHQAAIWHPGILAKYLLAHEVASSLNACATWLVVDTDAEDFTTLNTPARDSRAGLVRRAVRMASQPIAQQINAGVPPASIAPFDVPPLTPPDKTIPSIVSALSAISITLSHARLTATCAADQIARATLALIEPIAPRCAVIFASRVGSTDLFQRIALDMARNPERWATGYNDSLAAAPHAQLAPLRIASGGVIELPLWHLPGVNQPRQRVYASQLPALLRDGAAIAPRALLLTGLLRAAACELFIHGVGGAGTDGLSGYDAATTRWMTSMSLSLAPTISCTATLTLPLLDGPRTTPDQLAHLRWRAHAARHNPALVLDALGAQHKLVALHTIQHAATPLDRRAAFTALHHELASHQQRAAHALSDLNVKADAAAARLQQQLVADDRTFPFPLHKHDALLALRAEIAAQVRAALRAQPAGNAAI